MNSSSFHISNHPQKMRAALSLAAIGLLALAGCSNNSSAPATCTSSCSVACSSTTRPAAVAQSDQRAFATPEEAAGVLKDAAAARDRQTLLAIFGPDGQQLIFSGDPVEEENGLKKFAGHLSEYLRVARETPAKAVLYIGRENWPFPIPLVKSAKGWVFDTAVGKEEILNRRIGENELSAIAVARAYVTAQKTYVSRDPMGDKVIQYAQHFRSSEGKKDGLYWATGENEEISPMGPLVAEAQAEGYLKNTDAKHQPYKGYFFHILTAQGAAAPGGAMNYIVDGRLVKGFAMIAWPDSWGDSGVMTFVVNQDGKVYQKNLGEKTADVVKSITEYNPDATWEEVKD